VSELVVSFGSSAATGPVVTTHDRDGERHEAIAGYSRGVRRGSKIAVSGTTARGDAARGSTYEQTRDCIARAVASVLRLGGSRDDIVRTRVLLVPGADWEQAAAAHQELLGDVAPANTMVFVSGLVGDGLLVEVEADAEVAT
jgi:enamine deaminase RidA (YjgF/YER057c/UK114 family)